MGEEEIVQEDQWVFKEKEENSGQSKEKKRKK